MKQLREIVNRALEVLAGGSFIAMVVLTTWQVFTRYVLKSPSSWSEELVSYLFAWASLFGAAIVSGERGHMNIPVVVERMGHKMQVAFGVLAEVIAFLFSIAILLYGGIKISSLAMGQMTSALGVPIGVFYIVIPITGVLIMLYSILNIMDILKGNMSPIAGTEDTSTTNDGKGE